MTVPFKIDLENGIHVADVVAWELEKVLIHPEDLVNLGKEKGVPDEIMPEAPTSETTYRRVTRTPVPDGWLLRPVKRTGAPLIWGIVRETRDSETEKVIHRQVGTFRYDRDLEVAEFTVEAGDEDAKIARGIGSSLVAKWQSEQGCHVTEDITSWLTNVIKNRWKGFAMRRHGGAYVVLSQFAPEVRAVRDLIESIPNTTLAEVNILPQVNVDDTIVTMKRQARHSVEVQLAEMKRAVESFDTTTRDSTLRKRLAEYKDLQSRLDLYRGSLEIMTEDIEEALGTLQGKVGDLLGMGDELDLGE